MREPRQQRTQALEAEPDLDAARARDEDAADVELVPGRRTMTARLAGVLAGAVDDAGRRDAVAWAVAQRGGGRPLDARIRGPLERRLGADLADVRVHDDDIAAAIVGALGVAAFTWGREIFAGRRADDDVLAHEAGHAAQHTGATPEVDAASVELGGDRAGEDFADRAAAARHVDLPVAVPREAPRVRFKGADGVDVIGVIAAEMGSDEAKAKDMLRKASADGRASVEAAVRRNFAAEKAEEIIKAVPAGGGAKPPEVKVEEAKAEPAKKDGGDQGDAAKPGDKGKDGPKGGGGGAPDVAPPAGDATTAADDFGVEDLPTSDLDLIHQELIEHERWKSAKDVVGEAGSVERLMFIVDQGSRGAASGAATGGLMGLGGGLVTRLATRFTRVPGIGPMIAGGFSAYALLTKDFAESVDTIGKFGQGNSVYETIANSIAAVSEVLDILVNVANVIAGIIAVIAALIWLITIVTLGAAAPIAGALTGIAIKIAVISSAVDDVNKLILQPLVLLFRALHTFTSEADPRDVEAQGEGIAKAASEAASAVAGKAGTAGGGALADLGGGKPSGGGAAPDPGGAAAKPDPAAKPAADPTVDPAAPKSTPDPHAPAADPHAPAADPNAPKAAGDPSQPAADPNAPKSTPDPNAPDPAKTQKQVADADQQVQQNKKKGLEALREEWKKSRAEYEKNLADKREKLKANEEKKRAADEKVDADRKQKQDEIDAEKKKAHDAADEPARKAAEQAKADADEARRLADEAKKAADASTAADKQVAAAEAKKAAASTRVDAAEKAIAAVEAKKGGGAKAAADQLKVDTEASAARKQAELDAAQKALDADRRASAEQLATDMKKAGEAQKQLDAEHRANLEALKQIEDPEIRAQKQSELEADYAKRSAEARAAEDKAVLEAQTSQILRDAQAELAKQDADAAAAKGHEERLAAAQDAHARRLAELQRLEAEGQAAHEELAAAKQAVADAQRGIDEAKVEAAESKAAAEQAKQDAAAKATQAQGSAGDAKTAADKAAADKAAADEKAKDAADAADDAAAKQKKANAKDAKSETKKIKEEYEEKNQPGGLPKSEIGKQEVEDWWKEKTGQSAPKTAAEKQQEERDKQAKEAELKGGDIGKFAGLITGGPLGYVVGKSMGEKIGKSFVDYEYKKQQHEERFTPDNRQVPILGQPTKERPDPKYKDPPGSPADLAKIKEQIINDLGIRAKADAEEIRMQMELARSKGDKAKLAELEKQAKEGTAALKAHQAAVQRKDAAVQEQQERAKKADTLVGNGGSAAAKFAVIKAPLTAFAAFTWVGAKLGSDSFAKMNTEANNLTKRIDEYEAKMKKLKGDQEGPKGEHDKNKTKVGEVDQKAGASGDKLTEADQGRKAIEGQNEQKIGEAGAAKAEAAMVKEQRDQAAKGGKDKHKQLSADLLAWAREHKEARAVARKEAEAKEKGKQGDAQPAPPGGAPAPGGPAPQGPAEQPPPAPASEPSSLPPGDYPLPDPNGPQYA